MKSKTKDWLVLAALIASIVVLALLIVNINTIFNVPGVETGQVSVVNESMFDVSRGTNPEADVTIVEFYNFACGYCSKAVAEDRELIAHYGDKINLVLKHFGSGAKAAEAAECARDQGNFQEYHDLIFEKGSIGADALKGYARALGLDTAKFDSCLDSSEKQDIVDEDSKEGVLAGVKGTPTYFINGKMSPGYKQFSVLKSMIDKELEE